ncbi:uncharacterized protein LY89DRAFT_723790 [Mollisia scopiformis]|uniref:C2H2-type domain-containing protein n=1 Tax=Mollisia scopiformis TaxID=149040 RepID=A0A132BE38_MOLSC|nr:uncharacterized protein LY89DRAFT_723790 [Mollisia scopiformis]KUJ09937.1 hypothetical protein LY89DRAFT_723790 [Mollisia scopiformis]
MTSTDASNRFVTAIEDLRATLNSHDATAFATTKSEDVWKAAEDIQEAQRQRKSLRNMRRIEPFLKALGGYSKVIEVACNGTPYLPWVWAPIKLVLQLAAEHTNAFDTLIDAYKQIAQAMPQFVDLHKAFGNDENFQVVLSLVYKDILEFHRAAYRFFRRRAWHIFFGSLWKGFQFRFNGILKNLAQHQKLLRQQVQVIDLVEAKEWRTRNEEDIARQEKLTRDYWYHDSISWLKVAGIREDDLTALGEKRHEGTCEWVFRNPLFQTWKDDAHGEPVLWVKGIPGAGKTILSTYVIQQMQEQGGFTTAYHICNSYTTGKDLRGEILRSFAAQLLQSNRDLATYVFESYANKCLEPGIPKLKKLLPELLKTISSVRFIIDGLDEYPESEQTKILTELIQLTKETSSQCRVLFSNREGKQIDRALSSRPTISLRDQHDEVKRDIDIYVHSSLEDLRCTFGKSLIDQVQRRIVEQAKGMFLWTRLVLKSLEDCGSQDELRYAMSTLPEGLDQAYGRILQRILKDLKEEDSRKAFRILEWITCSFRLMKVHEIQDGIVMYRKDTELNEGSKLVDASFLNLCKPLVELNPKNNTVDFVHFSAKEYILRGESGPNGPFLNYTQAQYDLAFASMSYMRSNLRFIDTDVTEKERLVRVLKGFHGLHNYSNEFWFQHFLQYAKSKDYPIQDDELDEFIEDFSVFWKHDPGVGIKRLKLDDTTSADSIANQLQALANMPQAHKMGLDILTFRKFLSQEKYSHLSPENLKKEELHHDPTDFSKISLKYQEIVRSLIDCTTDNLPEGIQPHELDKFKQIYTDSAFICRYRECERYSDGFRTSADRDEHEQIHTKPLRCADPTCDFWRRGFTSKTGLMKHNRKYHPSPDELPLPDFEPRKEPELVVLPPPPVVPQAVAPQQRAAASSPVESSESEEVQPEKTAPKKGRVSRAKKNLPVHNCDRCSKVFSRNEGLERHKLSHQPPRFHCQYEGCGRPFFRKDLLDRHEKRHETITDTSQYSNGHNSALNNSGTSTPSGGSFYHATPASISVLSLLNGTQRQVLHEF